jgi:uncharacterized protein (TIGR03643 family)
MTQITHLEIIGKMGANDKELSFEEIDRIIEMAWEDRTPFDAIEQQFGCNESAVIALMRKHMKRSSFEMWRKRVTGRATKHVAHRGADVNRHRCAEQRIITHNKLSKR